MRVHYSKMHGLGNDFMLINAFEQPFAPSAERVRAWANRRTGVGFDQLLVVAPSREGDFAFSVFNADGSEAQQCGNGVRCAARFAQIKRLVDKRTMQAVVGDRAIQLELLEDGRVRADMGLPSFVAAEIPFLCNAVADRYEWEVAGRRLSGAVVSIGNPHVVSQVEALDDYPVAQVGAALQALDQFPQSVNAGFMQIENRGQVRLRVFERGAGETSACGSGACAAVAVGRRWGLLDHSVRVTQRGGDLDVEWSAAGEGIKMTGPAEYEYDGELNV